MTTIYRASDNQEFDTKEKCEMHEKWLRILNGTKAISFNGERVSYEDCPFFSKADIVYLANEEARSYFVQKAREWGYTGVNEIKKSNTTYLWNEEYHQWEDIEITFKKLEKLQSLYNKLKG